MTHQLIENSFERAVSNFVFIRSASNTKIVHEAKFYELHFSKLRDVYTVHRQYTGLPKGIPYIHFYCNCWA